MTLTRLEKKLNATSSSLGDIKTEEQSFGGTSITLKTLFL